MYMQLMNNLFMTTGGPAIGGTILSWVAGLGGALVATFLIISLIKDAFSFVKGSGQVSIVSLISKVLILILMIGLIAVAASGGFNALGQSLAQKGTDLIDTTATEIGG